MKCQVCGAEVSDSLLLCPHCGYEFRFIPDFEPEIEKEISDTLKEISLDELPDRQLTKEEIDAGYYYDENGELFYDGDVFDADGYLVDDADYEGDIYDSLGNLLSGEADDGFDDEVENEIAEKVDVNAPVSAQTVPLPSPSELNEANAAGPAVTAEIPELPDDDIKEYTPGDTADFGNRENLVPDMQETQDEEEYSDFDEEYEGEYLDDDDYDFDNDDLFHQLILAMQQSRFRKVYAGLLIAVLIAVAIAAVIIGRNIYKNNSYEYQAQIAKEAYEAGDVEDAVKHMEKALMLAPDNDQIKFDISDYYIASGYDDKALLMLWEIIYENNVNAPAAYDKLINYYADKEDYEMIRDILASCENQNVLATFNKYLANPPAFSVPEGEYDDVVTLNLTSESEGVIYYTLDGSEPEVGSEVYTGPITMELGNYDVNAIFVNSFGVKSEVAHSTYRIYVRVPDPPEVVLPEGEYTEPKLLEVNVQNFCSVYYTTDGTPPEMDDGTEYTGPFPLPLGHTHFIFATFSQEGVRSEIKELDYYLNIESPVDIQLVLASIKQYNLNKGKTTDLEGHITGKSSKYSYIVDSALRFDDKFYYLITESTTDSMGNSMKTGTYYLADMEDSSIYKAEKVEEDEGRENEGDESDVQAMAEKSPDDASRIFKISEEPIPPEDFAVPQVVPELEPMP